MTARRGFTLVELVASLTILAVISMSAILVTVQAADGYVDASVRASLHTETSVVLDRLAREIRSIPRDPGVIGNAPHIDEITPTRMLWRDSDGDSYSIILIGGALRLAVDGGGSAILLTDVSLISLRAYDEDHNALASSLNGAQCDPIRRVEVSITTSRTGVEETLQTLVFVRSTMAGGGS